MCRLASDWPIPPMNQMTRRRFIEAASAVGAAVAWGCVFTTPRAWCERRDLFPQGVASGGDAWAARESETGASWPRRPPSPESEARRLIVEIASDADFRRVVASGETAIGPEADWTCRFLAAGLKPRRQYFYRFIDE